MYKHSDQQYRESNKNYHYGIFSVFILISTKQATDLTRDVFYDL